MSYITIGSSDTLQLQLPSKGTTNWEQTLRLGAFQPLAIHDHVHSNGTGNNRGAPITDLAILLHNGGYLLARNNAGNANVNLLRLNTSNVLEIEPFINQEIQNSVKVTVAASSNTDVDETIISAVASQSLIIKYNIKEASTTALSQGTIYMDANALNHEEFPTNTFVKADDSEIVFTVGGANELNIENAHATKVYTINLHITRLG